MMLRTLSVALAAVTLGTGAVETTLHPATVHAWSVYAAATEKRINAELASPKGFLAMDSAASAAEHRRAVMSGSVVVSDVVTRDPAGEQMDIPDAMLHHWSGAVLIPNLTVGALLDRLQNGDLRPSRRMCSSRRCSSAALIGCASTCDCRNPST